MEAAPDVKEITEKAKARAEVKAESTASTQTVRPIRQRRKLRRQSTTKAARRRKCKGPSNTKPAKRRKGTRPSTTKPGKKRLRYPKKNLLKRKLLKQKLRIRMSPPRRN